MKRTAIFDYAPVVATTCAILGLATLASAQAPAPTPAQDDGGSPEAVVRALYESGSGAAGSHHDWSRFRGLFVDGARIVVVARDGSGHASARAQTVDEYVAAAGPNLEKTGFAEREVGRKEQRYGDIAQVWSAYEARRGTGKDAVALRGINSVQIALIDGRWKIVSLLWTNERSAGPVPAEYLDPAVTRVP